MTELEIGYCRVSTVDQDLGAQQNALVVLGVDLKRIYLDHGLTGTNRDRPRPRQALAACRAGRKVTESAVHPSRPPRR